MVQPIEGGIGSARTMRMALERRGVPADEVDMINPHGTSTPLGDKREAEAIWAVFGERSAAKRTSLAISGTKSMTGHMMGPRVRSRPSRRCCRSPSSASRRRSTTGTSIRTATCGS